MNPASVTPPLQSKFSHHDIFAIMLPGFMALMGLYLLANKFGLIKLLIKDFMPPVTMDTSPSEVQILFSTVAISMGILIASHITGEVLQICSLYFSKAVWWAYGDIPYFWIRFYNARKKNVQDHTTHCFEMCGCKTCCCGIFCCTRRRRMRRMRRFLPAATMMGILKYIEKDSGLPAGRALDRDIVTSYYPRIKGIAYMSPSFKELCEQVKVKSDMYRAYGTLSLFFCLSSLLLLQQNLKGNEHDLALLNLASAALFAGLSIDLFLRYRARTIEFFSFLFEGFLNSIKEESQGKGQQQISSETSKEVITSTEESKNKMQLQQGKTAEEAEGHQGDEHETEEAEDTSTNS